MKAWKAFLKPFEANKCENKYLTYVLFNTTFRNTQDVKG